MPEEEPTEADSDSAARAAARLFEMLRTTLGVSDLFLKRLTTDDDWTLMIKLHALLEAAMAHLITEHLGHKDLYSAFSRLDMSNPKSGKIAFARKLELLPRPFLTFIQKFSELRNDCAHNHKQFAFDLGAHVGKFDENQMEQWMGWMTFEAEGNIGTAEHPLTVGEVARKNPRFGMLSICLRILFRVYFHDREMQAKQMQQRILELEAECYRAMKAQGSVAGQESTPTE